MTKHKKFKHFLLQNQASDKLYLDRKCNCTMVTREDRCKKCTGIFVNKNIKEI